MLYTDEFKDRTVKEYMDGKSVKSIIETNNISEATLYRWLKERGIKLRSAKYSDKFKDKVVNEYVELQNAVPIAEKYDIPPLFIYN